MKHGILEDNKVRFSSFFRPHEEPVKLARALSGPSSSRGNSASVGMDEGRNSSRRFFYLHSAGDLTGPIRRGDRALPALRCQAAAGRSGWIHEIKHDGFRIMARLDTKGLRRISCSGND